MNKSILSLFFSLLLLGCQNTNAISEIIEKTNHELKIFIASDLHLLSNSLIGENNTKYFKNNLTSDGRVQEYDYVLLNSFIETINKEKPEYVLITGDLTFNGEYSSHEEVVSLLNKVDSKTKILIIPGNHDYNNLSAISLIDDKIEATKNLKYEEFADMYANFGYKDALSKDEESLSYIYQLTNSKWVVMLDTSLSKYNYDYDMNFVGGALSENSYKWLEKNLKYAKENNIEVITAMHHNLTIHSDVFYNNFTLNENEKIIDLLVNYNVKINFSGHLHIQSIKNYQNKIYDISNGSILDYGNRYGVLDIYENCYDYNSYKINVRSIENFEEYAFNTFYSKYFNKQVYSSELYYGKNGQNINDMCSKINAYYFDGNYEEIHKIMNENKRLVRKVKRNEKATYMQSIFEIENKNQHNLLIIK